jgi:hypothetical protein
MTGWAWMKVVRVYKTSCSSRPRRVKELTGPLRMVLGAVTFSLVMASTLRAILTWAMSHSAHL